MAVLRSHITSLSSAVQTPNQTKKFGGKSEKRWRGGRHLRLNSWMVRNTGLEFMHSTRLELLYLQSFKMLFMLKILGVSSRNIAKNQLLLFNIYLKMKDPKKNR